jgi:hypothetical protein
VTTTLHPWRSSSGGATFSLSQTRWFIAGVWLEYWVSLQHMQIYVRSSSSATVTIVSFSAHGWAVVGFWTLFRDRSFFGGCLWPSARFFTDHTSGGDLFFEHLAAITGILPLRFRRRSLIL